MCGFAGTGVKGSKNPYIAAMPKSPQKAASPKPAVSPKPAPAKPPAKASGKGDHVFLVDGSSYIFRAYHALPPLNRKSDGLQVNAVLGFCNMLWKLLRDMPEDNRPTHLAIIFDKSEVTFRNKLYPDYKAHRPPAPDDLIPQFKFIRDAVRAFDLPCLEQDGFEADDLIATYARLATERGASAIPATPLRSGGDRVSHSDGAPRPRSFLIGTRDAGITCFPRNGSALYQPSMLTSASTPERSLNTSDFGFAGIGGKSISVSGPCTFTRSRATPPPSSSTFTGT